MPGSCQQAQDLPAGTISEAAAYILTHLYLSEPYFVFNQKIPVLDKKGSSSTPCLSWQSGSPSLQAAPASLLCHIPA